MTSTGGPTRITAAPTQVMQTTAPALQRACACGQHTHGEGECAECKKKREGTLQRSALASGPDVAPPIVHDVLRSPGQPLDQATRTALEPRFGHDFSQVRVHTSEQAAESARAVNALAYTVGQHIVFSAGQYAPTTPGGQRLLAHELTHTVQQGDRPALQPQLQIGTTDDPAEAEATRVAEHVLAGEGAPAIHQAPAPALARQAGGQDTEEQAEPDFSAPQRRGGRPRAAFVDAGRRGEDQVRIAVTRYLCDCVGRNVTRTRASGRLQPRPGITLEICRGRVTGRIVGEVEPSSITTGRATVRGEVNIAPGSGGTGARIGVEAEGRNTGSEPQVGGRADVRVRLPGGQQVGVGGSVFRGTDTGTIDTEVGGGVDIGGVRVGVSGTNLQDPNRRGGQLTLGGNLPGQDVQEQTCRECRCPVVYECLEDIPPRDYEEDVTYDVEDQSRRRYYFQLDTNRDTPDPVLRAESRRMLDDLARLVGSGARIRAIVGYASPEDNRDRPTPNEQLSLSRGQRLRELLAGRLGAGVQLPEPTAGGELFGRVATIAPGSRLADAILDVGFGDPEDVTTFLIGNDIPNPDLADQFLQLLNRVSEPADRLRLFGVDTSSPAAPRLLAAIDQFVAQRGRGRRPWEGIFGFLRFATVELSQTRQETRTEQRRTSGSLTPISDAQCTPYARAAEREGQFGPVEPEPQNEAGCPRGEPRNLPRFEQKCDYD